MGTLFLACVSCYIISLLFTIEQLAISFNNLIVTLYLPQFSNYLRVQSGLTTFTFYTLLTYPTMTSQNVILSALRSQLLLAVDL